MSRTTLVHTAMPAGPGTEGEVEETWAVLTHGMGEEWWSEVLDAHRHPYVQQDEYGFDTVEKFYGDTAEESRKGALRALEDLVRRRGGRLLHVAEPPEE